MNKGIEVIIEQEDVLWSTNNQEVTKQQQQQQKRTYLKKSEIKDVAKMNNDLTELKEVPHTSKQTCCYNYNYYPKTKIKKYK